MFSNRYIRLRSDPLPPSIPLPLPGPFVDFSCIDFETLSNIRQIWRAWWRRSLTFELFTASLFADRWTSYRAPGPKPSFDNWVDAYVWAGEFTGIEHCHNWPKCTFDPTFHEQPGEKVMLNIELTNCVQSRFEVEALNPANGETRQLLETLERCDILWYDWDTKVRDEIKRDTLENVHEFNGELAVWLGRQYLYSLAHRKEWNWRDSESQFLNGDEVVEDNLDFWEDVEKVF